MGSLAKNDHFGSLCSEVPISRINKQVIVDRISRISIFTTNPDGKVIEEVEVVDQNIGQLQNSSPSHATSRDFQIQVISITPRNLQPRLASVPSSVPQYSPNLSADRQLSLASPFRPSPAH
ncbi:hypothetical protein O181_101811 [Austropuccinia psidii MF-1]|uniref:Uncharacterized protein n=1 Tax=Austropuccinia psidii MF-1 TaxID=1389203 RepID=A0A9Q3JHS3_9BASI|nr:hypothetical protein [Austropuccinia psidii MF-1]